MYGEERKFEFQVITKTYFLNCVIRVTRELDLSRVEYWQHSAKMAPWIVVALHNMMIGYVTNYLILCTLCAIRVEKQVGVNTY